MHCFRPFCWRAWQHSFRLKAGLCQNWGTHCQGTWINKKEGICSKLGICINLYQSVLLPCINNLNMLLVEFNVIWNPQSVSQFIIYACKEEHEIATLVAWGGVRQSQTCLWLLDIATFKMHVSAFASPGLILMFGENGYWGVTFIYIFNERWVQQAYNALYNALVAASR